MDGYEVISELGTGGFSEVYKVKDKRTGKVYAMKVLKYRYVNVEEDELQAYRHLLSNRNVVRCYKIIDEFTSAFIMEYCNLGSLNNFFVRHNPGRKIRIKCMRHIAAGVAHLHENSLAHRDLKPDNILITGTSSAPIVKIGDFGLAKRASDEFQGSLYQFYMTSAKGTIFFLAPEVHDGQYTAKADVFSMGLIFATIVCFRKSQHSSLLPAIIENDTLAPPADALRRGYEIDVLQRPKIEIPEELTDLIRAMVDVHPHVRPTAQEIEAIVHNITRGSSPNCILRVISRIVESAMDRADGPLSGTFSSG